MEYHAIAYGRNPIIARSSSDESATYRATVQNTPSQYTLITKHETHTTITYNTVAILISGFKIVPTGWGWGVGEGGGGGVVGRRREGTLYQWG